MKPLSSFLDSLSPCVYTSSFPGMQDSSNLMHQVKLCISMEVNKRVHCNQLKRHIYRILAKVSMRLVFHELESESKSATKQTYLFALEIGK